MELNAHPSTWQSLWPTKHTVVYSMLGHQLENSKKTTKMYEKKIKEQWLTIHVLQKEGKRRSFDTDGGVAVWGQTWVPCADSHGWQAIYLLLATDGFRMGIFSDVMQHPHGRMPCKKGGRTNLQFPIFRISYPGCRKHSLDSIVRPRRDNKLVWRWRTSYPSKVNGGQIKTIDVHELMYNNLKRKNMSCHHGILQKRS